MHATRLSISECGGVGEVRLAKSPWDVGASGRRARTRLCTLRKAAELWLLVVRVDREIVRRAIGLRLHRLVLMLALALAAVALHLARAR